MPAPDSAQLGRIDHTTKSDLGLLCDGPVCAVCGKCGSCGRVLTGPPHIEVCACPDTSVHEVCEPCTTYLDAVVAEQAAADAELERLHLLADDDGMPPLS